MIPPEVFQNQLRGFLEPVVTFLDDSSVTELMINGASEVFVERGGKLMRTDAKFASTDAVLSALRVVAQYVGRPLDELHPILEARLPDGSRLEALLPPIAPDGPAVAIRRFAKDRLTLEKLLHFGALTADACEALKAFVEAKQNIVVAGGTGSGKTSMLNAISRFIPDGERIVVIEDARELQLQRDHVVQLEARPADARGKGMVTIRDLFRATLRMRPDRIVLGEIRGAEALDLIQAMTSGHGGCLTTVHASYPRDTLNRLETMALMADVDLPLVALRSQLASAVNIIVQTARQSDGKRCVTHITEVCGVNAHGGYELKDVFLRVSQSQRPDTPSTHELVPTGAIPNCLEAIRSGGRELPDAIYSAAQQPLIPIR